jgi:hypothetical protein
MLCRLNIMHNLLFIMKINHSVFIKCPPRFSLSTHFSLHLLISSQQRLRIVLLDRRQLAADRDVRRRTGLGEAGDVDAFAENQGMLFKVLANCSTIIISTRRHVRSIRRSGSIQYIPPS